MNTSDKPYLSIVATSRNDDHGGDPLRRTQIFIDGLFAQCNRYRLPAELIIVEWNPPPDRSRLHEALSWSRQNEYCDVRIICVPPELHNRFEYSSKLLLYQMIAKNAGIRRARGDFVLATNIDILFSNELMALLAQQQMNPDRMYRLDRFDVPNTIPLDATIDDQLDFCWQNRIRSNFRGQTQPSHHCAESPNRVLACSRLLSTALLPVFLPLVEYTENVQEYTISREAPPEWLHTNACGDFTLLSKEKWGTLRGYPEFDAFSLHIDSLFCYMAHFSGVLETFIPAPYATFHIEHAIGSGWSPEGSKALMERIEKAGIPCLHYGMVHNWGEVMHSQGEGIVFNDETWGLSEFQLEEITIREGTASVPSSGSSYLPDASGSLQVTSLFPQYSFAKAQAEYLLKENRRLELGLQELVEAWEERGAWIEELQKAKEWLQDELNKAIRAWEERGAWIEELEKAKDWLAANRDSFQRRTENLQLALIEAQERIRILENEKRE